MNLQVIWLQGYNYEKWFQLNYQSMMACYETCPGKWESVTDIFMLNTWRNYKKNVIDGIV